METVAWFVPNSEATFLLKPLATESMGCCTPQGFKFNEKKINKGVDLFSCKKKQTKKTLGLYWDLFSFSSHPITEMGVTFCARKSLSREPRRRNAKKQGESLGSGRIAPVSDTWSLREGVRIERKQKVLFSSLAPETAVLWGEGYH